MKWNVALLGAAVSALTSRVDALEENVAHERHKNKKVVKEVVKVQTLRKKVKKKRKEKKLKMKQEQAKKNSGAKPKAQAKRKVQAKPPMSQSEREKMWAEAKSKQRQSLACFRVAQSLARYELIADGRTRDELGRARDCRGSVYQRAMDIQMQIRQCVYDPPAWIRNCKYYPHAKELMKTYAEQMGVPVSTLELEAAAPSV